MKTRKATVGVFGVWTIAGLVAACGPQTKPAPSAPPTVSIGKESVAVVRKEPISTGPMLSGELRPEREATVRAQVGGSVLDVSVEQGQPVKRGALLARIDVQAIRDAQLSAQSAVKSAEQSLQMATREAARTEMLVKGGALATRDLELAHNAVTTAQAQLAETKSRLAAATTQLENTYIRSPFAGVVSKRSVNTGDVVAPGAELFMVIDPSSMRFDASVPSEALRALRVNAPVHFQVRGYGDETFEGHIERISPVADPSTRLVPVFVSVPNSRGRLVAGLFAEGRVTTETRDALVVPASAVDTTGARPWVLRVTDGKAQRVDVRIGVRDDRTERVEVVMGVTEGDVLLTGAAHTLTPGTPVKVEGALAASLGDERR